MASRYGHSPHGECGLKSFLSLPISDSMGSLPARGVWLKYSEFANAVLDEFVTPRTGSVG